MDRYPLLRLNFIISLVFATVFLLISTDVASLIVTVGYFGTLLFFLFRNEAPPPTTYTEVPAVDYYRQNRFNPFNYALLAYAALTAALFAILFVNTAIPFGIVPFLSWAGIIGFIEVYKRRVPEDTRVVDMALNFIQKKLKERENTQIDRTTLTQLVAFMQNDEQEKAQELLKNNGYPPTLFATIQQMYVNYMQGVDEDLEIKEIEELN